MFNFIDWRYFHSLVGIFESACELLPPWTKELYSCTLAPLSSLWPPPPLHKINVQYIQTVCVWGGGGLCCRPYSAGILYSVSDQIQKQPNYFTTPNKMTSEDDIKGLVSVKFLRPWLHPSICRCQKLLVQYTWSSSLRRAVCVLIMIILKAMNTVLVKASLA